MKNLKYANELILDLIQQLKEIYKKSDRMAAIQVSFFDENHEFLVCGSLMWALDVIVNDLYWDEDANWSNAKHVIVEII